MHVSTALVALRTGMLATTRESLARPDHKVLGNPAKVRERLGRPMPMPFLGKVADYVPLSFTPRTPAVLGSCGRNLAEDAEPFAVGEIAIAVISLEDLIRSGLKSVFCDRLPGPGAQMFAEPRVDLVPWQAVQGIDAWRTFRPELERVRYNCEMLVWGGLPIAAGVEFAVADRRAADAFADLAANACSLAAQVLVRPGWVAVKEGGSSWRSSANSVASDLGSAPGYVADPGARPRNVGFARLRRECVMLCSVSPRDSEVVLAPISAQ